MKAWTPEKIRALANDSYCDDQHVNKLLGLAHAFEAAKGELEAARRLADAVRGHVSIPDYHRSVEMVEALAAYDAARAGQEGE